MVTKDALEGVRRAECPLTRVSLLEGVRSGGSPEAWRAFVDTYTPLVYRYCRARGLQESDACDVTQNVFLAVSQAMRSFQYDPQRGRFRSWLGRITHREICRYAMRLRRLHDEAAASAERQRVGPEQAGQSEWETQCVAQLLRQAMREVQPAFAADVWRAFELTWIDQAPPSEAASQLDRSLAWVYKAKFRVLGRLRETVQRLSDDLPLPPN